MQKMKITWCTLEWSCGALTDLVWNNLFMVNREEWFFRQNACSLSMKIPIFYTTVFYHYRLTTDETVKRKLVYMASWINNGRVWKNLVFPMSLGDKCTTLAPYPVSIWQIIANIVKTSVVTFKERESVARRKKSVKETKRPLHCLCSERPK